jgi:NAD(P) transhydrogenase
VQNMLISFAGEKRFPDKITPYSPPPVKTVEVEEVVEKSPEELLAEANLIQKSNAMKNAQISSVAAAALLAYGITAVDQDSVAIMSSFALAGLAGYQVVWGVAPALRKFCDFTICSQFYSMYFVL